MNNNSGDGDGGGDTIAAVLNLLETPLLEPTEAAALMAALRPLCRVVDGGDAAAHFLRYMAAESGCAALSSDALAVLLLATAMRSDAAIDAVVGPLLPGGALDHFLRWLGHARRKPASTRAVVRDMLAGAEPALTERFAPASAPLTEAATTTVDEIVGGWLDTVVKIDVPSDVRRVLWTAAFLLDRATPMCDALEPWEIPARVVRRMEKHRRNNDATVSWDEAEAVVGALWQDRSLAGGEGPPADGRLRRWWEAGADGRMWVRMQQGVEDGVPRRVVRRMRDDPDVGTGRLVFLGRGDFWWLVGK